MLKIFYARENVNKTKFIFENIGGKALLLVPDQFTLEAEKDVLKYTGAPGMMDIEVMSISRLGFRVLEELGGGRRERISKYGRHMLLTKLISDAENDGLLLMYSGMSRKPAFIEMLSDTISEIKQYGVSPEDLSLIAGEQDGILQKKLSDICTIFNNYEKKIEGRFSDTEDYIDLFLPKMSDSKLVRDKDIWLYGFDYLSPKSIDLICQLIAITDVNIVFTCDYGCRDEHIFAITQRMIKILCERSAEIGIECKAQKIDGELREIAKEITDIERELFFLPEGKQANNDVVTLVRASNYYTEAETAGAYITHLIRDKGLKLSDILVICNDTEKRGSVIKRIFSQYNLPLFIDTKRNLLGNPVAAYVSALIRSVSRIKTEDVIALLKTDLCREVTLDETERLENYVIKYKIRGTLWNTPFKYGEAEYGEEEFAELNEIRHRVSEHFARFSNEFKRSRLTSDRLSALYFFLKDDARLPEMIEAYVEQKEEIGLLEAGLETVQIWNELISLIEQFNSLLGDEMLSLEMIAKIVEAGLAAVEVSIIPPASDGLMLGNMQRTRAGEAKALVVIGANDGILPATSSQEGLLNEDEKIALIAGGTEICKPDAMRVQEEELSIYKRIASPCDYMYMSYSVSDLEGKPEKPARIFKDMCTLFPYLEVKNDITNRNNALELIQSRKSTLSHLAMLDRDNASVERGNAASWYRENDSENLRILEQGLMYSSRKPDLKREITNKIYDSNSTLSPTRLERYGKCPFAHFVAYGLKPEELRIFEVSGRESGEIYHECLLRLSILLNDEKNEIGWHNITKEQLNEIIDCLLSEQIETYREGILGLGEQERYKAQRLKQTLLLSAELLIHQVRSGKIKKMYFEIPFGRNSYIPPVEILTDSGKILVEGKIDRVDILEGDTVKIIDYKSGSEVFNVQEVESGFRIQLMLYLKAALNMTGYSNLEPAGVFYFYIKDMELMADGIEPGKIESSLEAELRKTFAMSGLVTDSRRSAENIAGDFTGWSNIVSGLRRVKDEDSEDGYSYAGKAFMQREEFSEFVKSFDKRLTQLAGDLLKGIVSVSPKRFGDKTSCDYCDYKSICRFDETLPGCSYDKITK
ncbi:MAG: exodeoxyribonuclease V subunit gamma [Eubacteriales bacterium]|nr:exodeoxyribonuclease V subunit gamma [Eubacteriales bacterium]MDD4390280.1 exodeoxyribonuclease V subunit gamma [Eubacteriales bacterium]